MKQLGVLGHRDALEKAEEAVERGVRTMPNDPHRPQAHAVPPVHWMNDPNGLIYYKGEYHLFYQFNPYGPAWGTIHWAHLKSKDLVHWERLPIALAPSETYDVDGCFSGSAVEHEGKLYLFYTANVFTTPVGIPDDLLQTQCVAVSEDGVTFEKLPNNPIIEAPPEHIGQTNHFRDPKVWKHDDAWYMVLGAKKDGRGKVIAYKSKDLLHWEFFQVLTESDGTMGYMHECPDLFPLGGKDVLLLCPEGVQSTPLSGYYVGEFDYETGRYAHGPFFKLDYGFDFYAPQTFTDDRGRRLLFGWMPMDGKALGKHWAGSMTLPRELTLDGDNLLRVRPAAEVEALRGNRLAHGEYVVTDDRLHEFSGMEGDAYEMIVTYDLSRSTAFEFGLLLRASEDGREQTVLAYDAAAGEVTFDRTLSGAGKQGISAYRLRRDASNTLELRVFLDRSTLELFVNDGEAAMTGFVFPAPDSRGVRHFAKGGAAAITRIDFWKLK